MSPAFATITKTAPFSEEDVALLNRVAVPATCASRPSTTRSLPMCPCAHVPMCPCAHVPAARQLEEHWIAAERRPAGIPVGPAPQCHGLAALSTCGLAQAESERFVDFCIRAGFATATGNGRDFHAQTRRQRNA